MFQETGFCPHVDYVVIATVQLILLSLQFACSVCLVCLEWRHKCKATPLLRSAAFFAVSAILLAPVLVGRLIWHAPLLLHFGPSIAYCLGIFTVYYGNGLFVLKHQLISCMRSLQKFAPEKVKAYNLWAPGIVLLCAVLHTVLVLDLIMGLRSAEDSMQRKAIITRFCGLLAVLFITFRLTPAFYVICLQRRVRKALPGGTPESFRRALLFEEYIQDVRLLLMSVPAIVFMGCFLSSHLGAAWGWHKYGGFLYLHVLSMFHIVQNIWCQAMLSIGLHQQLRMARDSRALLAKTRKLRVSELSETGISALEVSQLSQDAPPVSQRGVSLAFLDNFILSYNIPQHYTTAQVVETVVRPVTSAAKCSFWEAIFMSGGEEAGILLGKSTAMVSHSWANSFVDLVAILHSQCMKHGQPIGSTYFFLDIFCWNQDSVAGSTVTSTNGIDLLEELQKAVSYPSKMIMVLEPWYQPQALTRCWCLYELYLASKTGTTVLMAFSDYSEAQVTQALATNLDLAGDISRRVDVRSAQVTVEEDRKIIFAAIQGQMGIDGFNDLIKAKLSETLYLATLGLLFFHSKRALYFAAQCIDGVRRRLSQCVRAPERCFSGDICQCTRWLFGRRQDAASGRRKVDVYRKMLAPTTTVWGLHRRFCTAFPT